ncbi:hypothetical protein [Actinokineospora sp. NBRC 105648]|uniref:hypothetical protein n=1 Tax=Actinokineospora sp. NBRC 105648 TaxID=3032206 RepID=UPI002552388E|nr:hypothetical protein [Actinokineospora sp. NBRC 105648]
MSLLAACSDRPNDLYTYYDDPPSSEQAATTTSAPLPVAAATTTPAGPDPDEVVERASMTAADLVAEEVLPVGAPDTTSSATLPDCKLPLGGEAHRKTTWKYASGSQLRQSVVTVEDEGQALQKVRDGVKCKTFQSDNTTYRVEDGVTLGALSGVTGQLSWCATAPGKVVCTVVLVADGVLTAVTVEAGTATRARAAVTRIAPKAAAALTRGA